MTSNLKKLLMVGTAAIAISTFSTQASAAVTDVNGADATISADPAATPAITFTTDHVATVNDAVDITGTVTAGTTNFGTLTLAGSTTVSGAVGVNAGNVVKAVNAGAAGATVSFGATVDATNFNVTGTGTVGVTGLTTAAVDMAGAGALNSTGITGDVTLSAAGTITDTATITGALNFDAAGTVDAVAVTGATTFTTDGTLTVSGEYTGAIDAGTANYGTVNVDTAGVTAATAVGATNAIKKLALADVNFTSAGVVNAQTINVGSADLTVGAASGLATGQSLSFTLDTVNKGSIAAGGTLFTAAAGSTIYVNATEAEYEVTYDDATGDAGTYNFVTGSNGSATFASTVVSNIPGYTFTGSTDGTVMTITAAYESNTALWSNGDLALAQAYIVDGDAALDTFVAAVGSGDAEKEAVLPTVDGSSTVASIDAAVEVQAVADTRMASVRNITSGVAAGDAMGSKQFWMQGYYTYADQDLKDGIAGYESDTAGFMIGVDSEDIISNGVVGVAVNYAKVNADSENANTTDTEIDSFGATLYGSMDLSRDTFVEGQLGFAFNDIETTRHACGAATAVCNGETDGTQFSAKLAVGKDFAAHKNMRVTPKLYASYVGVENDGYTETDNGDAGATPLVVQETDVAALDLGVDVKVAWDVQARDGIMQPSFNIGYAYDTIADKVETNATFVAGGSAFKTTGADAAESKFNVGAGFVYETNADWDVSAKYDAVFKEDYYAHNAAVRFTTRF